MAFAFAAALLALSFGQMLSFQRAFVGTGLLREATGQDYDGETNGGALALMALEVIALPLAYFTPSLTFGYAPAWGFCLGLWVLAAWRHADRRLVRAVKSHALVTDGIFGVVRHPRYGLLLLSRLCLALVVGHAGVWLLFALWCALLVRRVRREEDHMLAKFSFAYRVYRKRVRARLIPYIF